jgi:hypothetical protein
MKRAYHTYLVLNYIFNVTNWRFTYNSLKFPKLNNIIAMIMLRLNVSSLHPLLLEGESPGGGYHQLLRHFMETFLLEFGMLDALPRSSNSCKCKQLLDHYLLLEGEVLLQRVLINVINISQHDIKRHLLSLQCEQHTFRSSGGATSCQRTQGPFQEFMRWKVVKTCYERYSIQ